MSTDFANTDRATAGTYVAPLLGQRLVGAKLISTDDLEAALQIQTQKGKRIGETLLEMGMVGEEQLLPFIEEQLGVPAVRLREGLLDPAAVRRIPQEFAQHWNVLALFNVRGTLTVAMNEPQNLDVIDRIEEMTGLTVRPVFAFPTAIQRMLTRCYGQDFEVAAVTADLDESAVELEADITQVELSSVEQLVEGSPVINLVNYLVLQAVHKNASDIHVEPTRDYTAVRFRIDGQLLEVLRPRRDIHAAIVSRIKVMSKMDIAEHRIPQDGRCQVTVEGKQIDLRISTIPTVLGEKAVIRVLDRQRLTFDLDKLGMPSQVLSEVKLLLRKPYGLLLVTGPTGSGKTTTLYCALELIKSVHRNIVTVEDPVEYQLSLVNQMQVDSARSLNFASALRAILRQDPDVIMVGEIRDAETAKVAVQAALTGHLVLSTLHTNDSCGAVVRMMDMGVESYKVAAALVGVIAQRLVRIVCPHCETTYFPPQEVLHAMHYTGNTRRAFVRGEGCRQCFDTGFQGRVGIYEVLTCTQPLRELISREAGLEAIRQWFNERGGQSLLECGINLAEQGITSLDEVARIALFE